MLHMIEVIIYLEKNSINLGMHKVWAFLMRLKKKFPVEIFLVFFLCGKYAQGTNITHVS